MADMKETCLDHVRGEDYIIYCTSEQKWLNKLRKQMERYPDEVVVTAENPDGSLVVRLPYSWFQAPKPPAKRRPRTEEERLAGAARLAAWRASQKDK